MTKTLYLFPDTTLFIQANDLKMLPWEAYDAFDSIELIVSRPTQTEIDKHKSTGHGRVQRKARTAAAYLREILLQAPHFILIRNASPQVTLKLNLEMRPDPKLANVLSYDRIDDSLVGTVAAFASMHQEHDVRVFAHDTGVIASALTTNIPLEVIPDDWLLQAEASVEDKENAKLKTELASYKASEPLVALSSPTGDETDGPVELSYVQYATLTDKEVQAMVALVKKRFPIVDTEVTNTKLLPRDATIYQMFAANLAVTAEDIKDYRDNRYPAWIAECERAFRSVHKAANATVRYPEIKFEAQNNGSRPAKNALVILAASGPLLLLARRSDKPNPKKDFSDVGLPKVPHGPRSRFRNVLLGMSGLNSMLGPHLRPSDFNTRLPTRDSNAFYWKQSHSLPAKRVELECELWRHNSARKTFSVEIHAESVGEEVSGMIRCEIHAENLTKHVHTDVKASVTVLPGDTAAFARSLIDKLVVEE